MIWLVYTNAIIDAQHVGGATRERLDDASRRGRVVTSILVIADLLYGAERSSRPEAGEALEILPITLSTAARFGVLKQRLASRGRTKPTWISISLPPQSTLALRWSPTTASSGLRRTGQ